jgi:D-alanyl-D-alanine endopeptidase (penicillin-binding protein 7)
MFYSSVTASANNAATALMRLSGLTKAQFLAQMNKEVKIAGALHSHFVDASGMDPNNVTTARDMALIIERAFQHPTIRRAASTATYQFVIRNTKEKKVLHDTNTLLTDDSEIWVIGGKTGYLEESKYNLATEVRPMTPDGKPVYGKDLLVVVFGAPDKAAQFITSKRLAQWAWENHEF